MVVMKLDVNWSSAKRSKRQLLPTPGVGERGERKDTRQAQPPKASSSWGRKVSSQEARAWCGLPACHRAGGAQPDFGFSTPLSPMSRILIR